MPFRIYRSRCKKSLEPNLGKIDQPKCRPNHIYLNIFYFYHTCKFQVIQMLVFIFIFCASNVQNPRVKNSFYCSKNTLGSKARRAAMLRQVSTARHTFLHLEIVWYQASMQRFHCNPFYATKSNKNKDCNGLRSPFASKFVLFLR